MFVSQNKINKQKLWNICNWWQQMLSKYVLLNESKRVNIWDPVEKWPRSWLRNLGFTFKNYTDGIKQKGANTFWANRLELDFYSSCYKSEDRWCENL